MARRRRAREQALTLRILAVAASVPLITRLGLASQARVLEPRREPPSDPAQAAWLAENVDRILATGRPLVRHGCLTRGLTLYYFLRRAGADVRLAYGIGEIDGRTEGHCWIVRDGEPYLEREDPRPHFVQTYVVPRAGAT